MRIRYALLLMQLAERKAGNMNKLKLTVVLGLAFIFALATVSTNTLQSQQQQNGPGGRSPVDGKTRRERFSHNGVIENEVPPMGQAPGGIPGNTKGNATEAPTGFDNLTNGYTEQGPAYETLNEDTAVAGRSHNDN